MNYKNIFTTYNSVDPPKWIETAPINEFPTITNPLYTLVDKVVESSNKDEQPEDKEKPKILNLSFLDKYRPWTTPITKTSKFTSLKEFINTMRPLYLKVLRELGLDDSYADYLVAQSALESSWGLKLSGNFNLGGIKVPSSLKGKGLGTLRRTREVIDGKDVYIEDEFRNFKDLEDYARFHVNLLNNKNYLAFNGDFISNVFRGGYATDPKYKEVLTNVYNLIKQS